MQKLCTNNCYRVMEIFLEQALLCSVQNKYEMSKIGNINYRPDKCNLETQTESFPDQERLLKQVDGS